MPAVEVHQRSAIDNHQVLKYLQERVVDFPQWVTTVTFYTALQVVEAILAKDGLHPTSHETRNSILRRENRYQSLWRFYRPLWNDSLIARYLTSDDGSIYSSFADYLPPAKVVSIHINHNLHQLIQRARTVIGDQDFLA